MLRTGRAELVGMKFQQVAQLFRARQNAPALLEREGLSLTEYIAEACQSRNPEFALGRRARSKHWTA